MAIVFFLFCFFLWFYLNKCHKGRIRDVIISFIIIILGIIVMGVVWLICDKIFPVV